MTAGRTNESGTHRKALWTNLFVSVVVCAAVCLLWLGYVVAGRPYATGALGVLAVLAVTGWVLREGDVGHRVQFSSTSIVLLASAVIIGPVGSGLVGLVSNLTEWRRGRPVVCAFNAAMHSVVGSVGGLVFFALTGPHAIEQVHGALDIIGRIGAPLLVADIAQCGTNAVLLAGVMRVSAGVPARTQIIKLLSTTGVAYVGYGVIGFLFVVLWVPAEVGWFSAVLVLAPLFVARWAFVQYGDELRAQDRTLRALVTAGEIKDPSSAGHSDRTAQLAEWLAETLGLGHKEIQEVRTAAMLHDIGKVCVPTRLLRSRQVLSDDQLVVMAEHALSGVDLVQGIDFLFGSVHGIAHHHERYDGRGYPAGLSGDRIPLVARIVAVADAFDSLTTSRPYRRAATVEGALAVMAARAGSQFDPQIVEALRRALARHDWTPTERTPDQLAAAGVALDHDEPEISDLFATRRDLRDRVQGATTSVALPTGSHR
ncbi:HD-GYP domain-containing protein [Pedococcus sp. 5OH_020]|uniref:HD-GYP domain-containing protein n=1 Tax=Pedococcus sp. 5OH_020 TaxID=2989814 RepID=UPI0022E9F491|nr:HD-GYP domain-containing protein [Pedococcus sp. 5OH_020]